jgi:membrane protein YqaA with SNARE-associated domain
VLYLAKSGMAGLPMTADSLGPFAALFATAFLAATLLPAQSELLLGYLLVSGQQSWILLLAVATAGNVLGSIVNWLLGRSIERFRNRPWFPVDAKALERAERAYARWGKWSLLLSWVPIIGDPLTLVAGLLRTPFPTFLGLVLLAKGGRYGAIAWGVAAAANVAG